MRNIRMESRMDDLDRALLRALQRDATLTAEALGRLLNLSPSQAGRRRARLEQAGLIRATVARLDPGKLGLTVQAFVQVQMATHTPDRARAFLRLLEAEPRVASVWTMTGEADYLLRVWCADLAALNDLLHRVLLPHESVARVQSQIVLDQPKRDAPLPV
ncbi:DNA-binding transcriptional regulator, Lrp family [Jannaschia seohaensis]|uniref:DNA-binding Lrp family transcriptional regulator n=2 Tax=Jannaschia seohaensis TaxID=475081 RepID=A0A2Y9AXG6_9RHOB|nr:DNA-binding Lrp family transcriptional regulator [Jannaschia seohaensis]SSA46749.1 DNA-binding transcriptional regulator, Lrp family [Jannaschia seohaensis]